MRPPRSVRRSSPGWPKGCGRRSTPSPPRWEEDAEFSPAPDRTLADLQPRRVAARRRALPLLDDLTPSPIKRVRPSARPRDGRPATPARVRARGSDGPPFRPPASASSAARCTHTMSLGAASSTAVEVLAAREECTQPCHVRWLAVLLDHLARRHRARPPSRPRRCAAIAGAAARRHARRHSATPRPPRTGPAPPGSGRCGRSSTDADALHRHAVDRVDLRGEQAIRFSSGSETMSSSIARPAPCSRISIANTSPRTAPIRLATWPERAGSVGHPDSDDDGDHTAAR